MTGPEARVVYPGGDRKYPILRKVQYTDDSVIALFYWDRNKVIRQSGHPRLPLQNVTKAATAALILFIQQGWVLYDDATLRNSDGVRR